jgi:hypothetical protein
MVNNPILSVIYKSGERRDKEGPGTRKSNAPFPPAWGREVYMLSTKREK